MVNGFGRTAGAAISSHMDVDMVTSAFLSSLCNPLHDHQFIYSEPIAFFRYVLRDLLRLGGW